MDDNTKSDSGINSVVDNKTQQLSKKVWSLETKKDSIMNINSDGSIPLNMQRTMINNKMFLTDYVTDTGKRRYIQKINNQVEFKDI